MGNPKQNWQGFCVALCQSMEETSIEGALHEVSLKSKGATA
jgi:hypothetical protein